MRRITLPLIAALGFALAGCQTEAGACPTPPPNQPEQRPLPPVANYEQTWQPGHWSWDWDSSGYAWQPGAWVQRGPHTVEWMNGYWTRTASPGSCTWVPAHWQAGQ
jgi:hypothetical protein